MTKKLISLALALGMCLSLTLSATAAEKGRVHITVENEDQILDFYNSPEYDPNMRYSFTYPNPRQPRIRCPKCGYNTYMGFIDDEEGDVLDKTCPTGLSMESDMVVAMITCTYQFCETCDYKTKEIRKVTKYQILCSLSPVPFWAKPGQTVKQGYDWHECYSTWGL